MVASGVALGGIQCASGCVQGPLPTWPRSRTERKSCQKSWHGQVASSDRGDQSGPQPLSHPRRSCPRVGGSSIRTVRWFGDRVYRIVDDCTDGMPGSDGRKQPTADRRAAYLPRLAAADQSALLVSASDKLHNARSIAADLRLKGDDVWGRFNLGKDDQLAWYGGLVDAYRANPAHHVELVDELDRVVKEMRRLADEAELAAGR